MINRVIHKVQTALLVASFFWAGAASAGQDLMESYVAVIGVDDLYNSKGARLHEPWQILRQDRANFHRFGIRQQGDQGDRFFARKENRAIMKRMVINGYIDPQAARNIQSGNAWVLVEIYGSGGIADYVNVTVHR